MEGSMKKLRRLDGQDANVRRVVHEGSQLTMGTFVDEDMSLR
jgi:hypothetical protein